MPRLLIVYAVANGSVRNARPDAMLITRPRPDAALRSAGSAAPVTRHGPIRLMSMTASASSPGRSPALCGKATPAQLISTSTPPTRSIAAETAEAPDPGRDGRVDRRVVAHVAGDDVVGGVQVEPGDRAAALAQRRGRRRA